jgi:hypothetical protein
MTDPSDDKEAILVDTSGLRVDDVLASSDSPLLQALQRLSDEAHTEPTAGFSQGLS